MISDAPSVFLIGPRYGHHASHSGYEGFHKYIGTHVAPPIRQRFLAGRLGNLPVLGDFGWRLDQLASRLSPRTLYSFPILLLEAHTMAHMLRRRGAVYHILYGDSDFSLLGAAARRTGNFTCAPSHDPPDILEWLNVQSVAHHLDGVIVLAESQLEFFLRFLPPERVFLVPHGIDTGFYRPSGKSPGRDVIVTVGSKLRDFTALADAMRIVWKDRPKATLIAVGTRRMGDSNPHLDLDDPRVIYMDGIDDHSLLSIYQQADLAVLPLKGATANNALLEAMACGLPVVATAIGGIAEYVGGTGAARLCPPGDSGHLAEAMVDVLEGGSVASAMSTASRQRALQFDFTQVASQMGAVFRRIAGVEPEHAYTFRRHP